MMIRILLVVLSLGISSASWGAQSVYRGPKGARLSIDSSVEGKALLDFYLKISGEFYTGSIKEVDGGRSGKLKFYQQSTDEAVVFGEVTLKQVSADTLNLTVVLDPKASRMGKPDPSGDYIKLDYEGQEKLARKLYGEADRKLNEVYGRVMGKFSKEKRVALRMDERKWIEYRDYMAEHQGVLYLPGDDDIIKKIRYWDALADLTYERVGILQLREQGNPDELISGVWVSGQGGRMEISLNEVDNKKGIDFKIYVISLPHAHIAEIEGFAVFSKPGNRKAVFVDTDPDFFVDGKPCQIELSFDGEKIKIEEMNSRNYRGKHAYFTATYFRLGPLKSP